MTDGPQDIPHGRLVVDVTGPGAVVVELPLPSGRQSVALSVEELAAKSAEVLDRSMDTIRSMAQRVTTTMESLGRLRPNEVEVMFAIKFDAQAGAILTKVGAEANFEVTLTWRSDGS